MPQVKTRGENAFTGGINNEQSPVFVADDETTDHYGFDFDNYPNMSVRKGKTTYGASGGAQTNLMTYFNSVLIRSVGTKLQRDNAGTWVDIAGTFADSDWTTTNFEVDGSKALILTNGTDAVQYTTDGSSVSGLSVDAPTGKFVTSDPSRVFVAKDDVLYWCGFQDPTDWTSEENSGFAEYYTAEGGDITALRAFKDIKYVWKRNSMAGLYGVNYFDFRIIEVSNSIGCSSHKTVQEVDGILFWLGESEVYMYTQGNPKPIGNKIRGFLNRINKAHFSKACAFTDQIRYYLCLPLDNATEPNIRLVWDTRYDRWRVCAYSENFRYGTTLNGTMYVGTSSGQTYKVNDGTTDAGTAIPWMLESKAFSEGIFEAEKEYKELHYQGEFPSGTSVSIAISTDSDGDTFTALPYDPTSPSSIAANRNIIVPLDTTPLANWFRYRISGQGPASFYAVQRYFRVCRVQR